MPIGFALAAGFTAVLVGTAAAAAVNRHDPTLRVAVVAAFVAVAAALSATLAGAACAAGMGWLFTNGFLVNRGGDLAWRGTADLVRVAVLVAAALAGLALGRAWLRRDAGTDGGGEEPAGPADVVDTLDAHRARGLLPWQRGPHPPGFQPTGPRQL
jgi:hypothetical protein